MTLDAAGAAATRGGGTDAAAAASIAGGTGVLGPGDAGVLDALLRPDAATRGHAAGGRSRESGMILR